MNILEKFHQRRSILEFHEFKKRLYAAAVIYFEFGVIILWAIWVCRDILDFTPTHFLVGGEYPMVTQYHFIWANFQKCGPCVFWNGFTNGGAPAFAELQGGVLHPYIIVTTLIWGVINGGKVTLLLSLITAGLAVWKITKSLGMRMPVRLWAGCMAVVAGNLGGKIENGGILLVLATAWATVTLAALVDLILKNKISTAVWLGIALAMTLLSGQGYIQISLLFIFIPAILIFMLREFRSPGSLGKNFLISLGVTALLTGVFWVPLLHFLPFFVKEADPQMTYLQTFQYQVFNLLVHDFMYYRTDILGKGTAPFIYINYIGWIPFLLALISFHFAPKKSRRLYLFFYISIFCLLFFSSSEGFRLLYKIAPISAFIRYPSLMTSLASPIIMVLAAATMNALLDLKWPKFELVIENRSGVDLPYRWVIILGIFIASIIPAYTFTRYYIGGTETRDVPEKVVSAVSTASTEWVSVPYSEYQWIPYLLDRGMKISQTYRPWQWVGRDIPASYYEITRDEAAKKDPGYVEEIDGLYIIKHPENEYAYILQKNGEKYPCEASSTGGNIDVTCDQKSPSGTLVVQENSWSGWKVSVDGKKQPLLRSNWLQTTAGSGAHVYSFRYRPLDVYIGMFFSAIGILAVIYLLGWADKRVTSRVPSVEPQESVSPLEEALKGI